mmetsp:Transcript_106469/g.159256  ORF Transcript_106469/g.159256 Transcript_106469/m.159256 type:complete len:135 (+) Transcript_106469:128-532(+)
MGGTKRMSMEEKRKVILEIYHKTEQVYTEKEIIALAAKAGVNSNSIPDVHQSLIDDGLVEKEKNWRVKLLLVFQGEEGSNGPKDTRANPQTGRRTQTQGGRSLGQTCRCQAGTGGSGRRRRDESQQIGSSRPTL